MKRTAAAFAIVFALASVAQAITMGEAVNTAASRNYRIKQFVHLSNAAQEQVEADKGPFWPSVDIGYEFVDFNPSGGPSVSFFSSGTTSSASVSVTYNLFNGFSDLKQLKESKARASAAGYEYQAAVADVVLDVKSAYIELLRSRAAVDVAKESVELLEQQQREAELFFREGLFAKNDVLKVEVELSSARQDLIRAEGDLRVGRKRLERAMGVSLNPDEVVLDVEGLPGETALTYDELGPEALERRSELKQLRSLADAFRYSMQSVRGGYLPSLDVTFEHTEYGDSVLIDGRQSLYDRENRAMITATWNIFDGFTRRHEAGRERANMEAALEQLRDAEQEVLLQVKEAAEGYASALATFEAAETAVKQAEENYRVTQNRFKSLVATNTDLLDARFFLSRARNQRNNARYDVHLWSARIERATEAFSTAQEHQ